MIGLIFSQSSNGYIGKDGKLLFQIPEDMKRFRALTNGCEVIMGRKTWDSLPQQFRPLPNRNNHVVSSNWKTLDEQSSGCLYHCDLRHAILKANLSGNNIWIIGGESLLKEGLKYADVIEQTFVTEAFDGDARAPEIDPASWETLPGTSQGEFREHVGLYYQFNTYRKIAK